MTSAQVVETSATNNSSFQNYSHPDDHNIRTTYTPGFKPFTMLLRECYTQATCLATLQKVEGRCTFLATRNATIAVAKWGVTRAFFLATCNATFVALQVARKIASCNMALRPCFVVS